MHRHLVTRGTADAGRGRKQAGPEARQRGAAALIVTMLLFFAMLLAAVFVNRNLVFEQRASANQYRSTQAFEAAEAGLEWALAHLNDSRRIGPDCESVADAAADSFRDRYLVYQPATARFAATTWLAGSVATPLQPACLRTAAGWTCSCPAHGPAGLTAPAGDDARPAFGLQFFAGPKAGLVRVVATGCSRLAAPCVPGATARSDASARIEVLLALLPGLRTPPVAALTVRGDVAAGTAAIGAHNPDPSTGLAIDAGGTLGAPQARVTPPAGAASATALVGNDGALAALAPDRLFAAYFSLAPNDWKNQPAVRRVACGGGCGAEVAAAFGSGGPDRLFWIDGPLQLDGPLEVGSPQRPVIVVVDGALALNGAVRVHGVVYASAVTWNGTTGPGAFVRGALVSAGGYSGDASPDLFYDTAVLAALRGDSGSFTRVSGSWRDF